MPHADEVLSTPVQFLKGLYTLYGAGARIFVETGPKRALWGFAEDVLGGRGIQGFHTNHPKLGGLVTFNSALCGLYASGLGVGRSCDSHPSSASPRPARRAETS